jgi:ABC-2 type transport system ATP-binding protein
MPVIEVKNLQKHFGKTKAVDGVSFAVEKGEIFGFLGPNGAGKTTTIRCMMDFVRPTEGEIEILDKNAQKDSVALKRKIGYLSDSPRFYDHWTVSKHLAFQGTLRGRSQIIKDLLQKFGLNQKLRFSNLSSGNKRKLSIILALRNQPEVLILDEPTLSLDPLLQNAFHLYIEDFARAGGTVFMSSHNLSEVEKICDRVGIIKEGKMVTVEKISDMKLMKMYDVNFRAQTVDPKMFEDKNTEVVSHTEGLVTLKVKGDINPIIKKLAQIQVKDLEIIHVSLEDIFLEFYEASRNPAEVPPSGTKEDRK